MTAASLSTTADADPLRVAERWIERVAASGLRRNPSAMALATHGDQGRASVRMVLLKKLAADPGYAVFYTNYASRKARELERCAWAAGVLYWEEYGRQIRIEGPVVKSPADESDAYFASRPLRSQLNAWVSAQSEPLEDPGDLERRADQMAGDLAAQGASLARPPFWGGYRLWCEAVELWTEGAGRFHTRLRFERTLTPQSGGGFAPGPWRSRRLQP
ncbi:MAG: pyridoxal 5'-phosphate synthase [Gammaproteobacteria bacterium]|nr:pyridoxal 5'-phosphate synthase [Gammaproteobacteria bacterium]